MLGQRVKGQLKEKLDNLAIGEVVEEEGINNWFFNKTPYDPHQDPPCT